MIRKYHNHTRQTNPRYRKEEQQNTDCHNTTGRHLKQSNRLSLPYQNDCKTRRTQSTKYVTKQGPFTESPQTMGANPYIARSLKYW